jgi:hypothetical protein
MVASRKNRHRRHDTTPPGRIPVCQETYNLCTNCCPIRSTCRTTRTPFLIPAIAINYRTHTVAAEAYINELAVLRSDWQNLAGHLGGLDSEHEFRTNLKIEVIKGMIYREIKSL